MKRVIVFLLALTLGQTAIKAQDTENLTHEYINGIFYFKMLDNLRGSYDKARMLNRDGYEGMLKGIYGTLYDFNFGIDSDKLLGTPKMYGMAVGDTKSVKWGAHVLAYSTSNASYSNLSKEFRRAISPDRFRAITVGGSYDFKYLYLTADYTYAAGVSSLYGRVFVPFLRTHVGVGTSQFDEIIDPIDQQKKIIKSKVFSFDNVQFVTSAIPYLNLGLKVYRISQLRYAPNVYFSVHQFFKKSVWEKFRWDADFFFETRTSDLLKISEMEDYDARFTLYWLSRPGLFVKNKDENAPIDVRATVFAGVSYKSETDIYNQAISESGMVYNGQQGLGIEVGAGLRVLGFKRLGYMEDTYIRLSYYNNYSAYFERYPGMMQGVKFRVIL